MKRIKYLIPVLVLFLAPDLQGQSLKDLLSSDNLGIVQEVTKRSVGIIRQEFQLRDSSGRKYNLDTLGYFGVTESLCVKTTRGYITSANILNPWVGNEDFNDFKEYSPVISDFGIFSESENQWTVATPIEAECTAQIESSDQIIVCSDLFGGKGFEIDGTSGDKEGWIVWIRQESTKLSFSAVRQSLAVNDSTSMYKVKQPVSDEYTIGLFLCPDYSMAGSVSFVLSGIVQLFSDGWNAIPIKYEEPQPKAGHVLVEAGEDVNPEILPVSGEKRKSKSDKKKQSKK